MLSTQSGEWRFVIDVDLTRAVWGYRRFASKTRRKVITGSAVSGLARLRRVWLLLGENLRHYRSESSWDYLFRRYRCEIPLLDGEPIIRSSITKMFKDNVSSIIGEIFRHSLFDDVLQDKVLKRSEKCLFLLKGIDTPSFLLDFAV